MKIKDFSAGDIVYVLTENRWRNTAPVITETSVKVVGRKYVTINNARESKFEEREENYLKEYVTCGESRLLFKTKQDAENYIEKKNLALWLGCMSVSSAEKYSLEQLQKVKKY